MSDPGLGLVLRQGFGLALTLLLPVLGGAVVASAAASLLTGRVGIQDPTVGMLVRALAVVLALGLSIEIVRTDLVAWTQEVWSLLADVGDGAAR